MARHILVVDDDGDVRDVIVNILVENGIVAMAATGGIVMRDLLAAADTIRFDAIVLDALMPGEPSADLALHAKTLKIPVVMISGSHDSMTFADEHGLQLLRKPFRMAELLQAIEDAIGSGEFGQRDA